MTHFHTWNTFNYIVTKITDNYLIWFSVKVITGTWHLFTFLVCFSPLPHSPFSYHHFFSNFCNSPFSRSSRTASVIRSLKDKVISSHSTFTYNDIHVYWWVCQLTLISTGIDKLGLEIGFNSLQLGLSPLENITPIQRHSRNVFC